MNKKPLKNPTSIPEDSVWVGSREACAILQYEGLPITYVSFTRAVLPKFHIPFVNLSKGKKRATFRMKRADVLDLAKRMIKGEVIYPIAKGVRKAEVKTFIDWQRKQNGKK